MISFGSFIRQLARDLWSQKLRTFLTTFGIIWGTVAVSLLLAFGNGLHRQMIKSAAGLGDRIVIAWPMRTSMTYEGLGKGRRMRMMEEDIAYLEAQVPLIDGISSEYSQRLIARFGDRQRLVDVSGVSPVFGTMRNMIPAPGGRFINNLDIEHRRRVVFVGNRLADDLNDHQTAGELHQGGARCLRVQRCIFWLAHTCGQTRQVRHCHFFLRCREKGAQAIGRHGQKLQVCARVAATLCQGRETGSRQGRVDRA